METCNLNDKKEYVREYFECCSREWGSTTSLEEFERKIDSKVQKYLEGKINKIVSVLLLIENDNLIGFISLLKEDGEERKDLTPWYATMYVKEDYRKKGYSRILNQAILEEARKLHYKKVYLKTDLINYYEKFGAHFLEALKNGEKLYFIDL